MNVLTIVSRKSILAKLQAIEVSETIKKKFPETKIIFKTKDTSGDIDLTTPLHKMPEMGSLLQTLGKNCYLEKLTLQCILGKTCQLILKKEQK